MKTKYASTIMEYLYLQDHGWKLDNSFYQLGSIIFVMQRKRK